MTATVSRGSTPSSPDGPTTRPSSRQASPPRGLFTGADGTKTAEQVELFGGTAGITYDPNYHSPEDDIKNISLEALDINSDAIAAAAITLAQDTSSINGQRSTGTSGTSKPKAKYTHDAAA